MERSIPDEITLEGHHTTFSTVDTHTTIQIFYINRAEHIGHRTIKQESHGTNKSSIFYVSLVLNFLAGSSKI